MAPRVKKTKKRQGRIERFEPSIQRIYVGRQMGGLINLNIKRIYIAK